MMLFEVMITVASFDILPSGDMLPSMFPNLDEEEPYTLNFETMGQETHYIIFNMGTMFFVFSMISLFLACYLPCKFCGKWSKISKALTKKLNRTMFYNWPIVFV